MTDLECYRSQTTYDALIQALANVRPDPATGKLEPHCFVEALGEVGGIWPRQCWTIQRVNLPGEPSNKNTLTLERDRDIQKSQDAAMEDEMAKSAAERKRASRERQRDALKIAPDLTLDFIRRPLSEFHGGNYEFEEWLDGLGFPNLGYLGDEHAEFHSESLATYSGKTNLERMNRLAHVFLEGAEEVCRVINEYKLSEIDARILEIEEADLADPAVKKKALADIVTLTQIRARLDKEFRRSFREINVKGTPSD